MPIAETATDVVPSASGPVWQIPALDDDDKVVSGTAAGIATELGISAVYVRAAFVSLTIAGGWGVALYLAAWVLLQRRPEPENYAPRPKLLSDAERLAGVAMIVTGLLVAASLIGGLFEPAIAWPFALVASAVAVALDRDQLDARHLTESTIGDDIGPRLALGLGCLFAAVIVVLGLSVSFWQAISGIVVAGLVLAGAAIVFAPAVRRLADELLAERRRRIRSDERADLAAHLHDSVLQTLTLIQKRSDDTAVVNLARRQERELRSWLFDERGPDDPRGVRDELEALMAEVEDLHQVPIELVVVGDRASTQEVDPILKAAREAATNAARHSGASRIDVFAEVADDRIEIFVRDQGRGFEVDAIDDDRAGVRDSILGRMERHGGEARVVSAPNEGAEIELVLPLSEVRQGARDE